MMIQFGSPINFQISAMDVREASRHYGKLIKEEWIEPPKHLGVLIRFRENEGNWKYWDVREFLKEVGIKIERADKK